MEKPSTSSQFVQPRTTHQTSSGPILALDKDTGQEPWKFNVAGPIMVGGPPVGDGTLFLPTGKFKGILDLEDR
jgi:outer membrane protein assembly factor BamB